MELEDFVLMIFDQAEIEARLRTMSNQQLANLLLNHVWAEMDSTKPQSVLLSVVIDRLQGESK